MDFGELTANPDYAHCKYIWSRTLSVAGTDVIVGSYVGNKFSISSVKDAAYGKITATHTATSLAGKAKLTYTQPLWVASGACDDSREFTYVATTDVNYVVDADAPADQSVPDLTTKAGTAKCVSYKTVTVPKELEGFVKYESGKLKFTKVTDKKYAGSHKIKIVHSSSWDKELFSKEMNVVINDKECEPAGFKATNAAGLTVALVDNTKVENIDLSKAFTVTSGNKACTLTYNLAWASDIVKHS